MTGSHEFFVDEAAEELRASLVSPETDVERISDEDLADRLPIALTHGSLFAEKRVVEADLSALFGRESPGSLLEEAVEAWNKDTPSGRREAFKKARALLAALRIQGSPEEAAAAAARKARHPEAAEALLEILRALPGPIGDAAPAASAVLEHLERGLPGTILIARAVDPPKTSPLYQAFRKHGTIQDVSSKPEEFARFLASRAKKLAAEKDVALDPAAVEALLRLTEADPRRFDSELEKVLAWAESGGKVRVRDVEALVADGRSEDLYAFFDFLGRRDRAETFHRLGRVLSGRALRAGDREVKGDDPLRGFFSDVLLGSAKAPDRQGALRRDANEDRSLDHFRNLHGPGSSASFRARGAVLLVAPRGEPLSLVQVLPARREILGGGAAERPHRVRGSR